ncbi:LysE family translocator [Marinomonas mediterranea]|uniref:LysE family translocator n=1 Tax=Marinomonas mediterranea TaxID=119864 RepID=UPI00234A719C|nr:LysE family translocator [Marinomonas mediterranea]WCN08842.1 LysE family transporter [Marinomonas mediterranea]
MSIDTFLLYAVVAFFYVISPGPAVFLALYNGAVNGLKVVMSSALGNILGLLVLSSCSISGLSALLLASATLFTIVKVVGASYLIYLGIKQIWATFKGAQKVSYQKEDSGKTLFSYFKEGFFVAVTNPKPILFFVALFPQFLNTNASLAPQFAIMTSLFMAYSFISLTIYGALANRAKHFLSRGNNISWFHRLSGGIFVGLGASLLQVKATS